MGNFRFKIGDAVARNKEISTTEYLKSILTKEQLKKAEETWDAMQEFRKKKQSHSIDLKELKPYIGGKSDLHRR